MCIEHWKFDCSMIEKTITERNIVRKVKRKITKESFFMKKPSFVVGRGGFEPPKSETSDLQSDPFGRSGICP